MLSISFFKATLTVTETQREAEGNNKEYMKRDKEQREEGKEDKEGNIKLLRGKSQSNLEGNTRQMSKDQSLEPTACAVPGSTV